MNNHTVLLVEDDEELRESMRDALEIEGYVVVAANDGLEALEQLDRIDHIRLVLLDLLMPRMNGWDVFAQMRARPELASARRRAFGGAEPGPRRRHEGASEAASDGSAARCCSRALRCLNDRARSSITSRQ